MNQTTRQTSARSLWQRLRPFIRRDLKGRLISASIAALIIAGLSWFGISAFTHLDSSRAKDVRVQLGLEYANAVCAPVDGMPDCSFDDRVQAVTDEQWYRDVRIRSAIIHELELRLAATRANLDEAKDMLERQQFDFGNGLPAGGDVRLAELLRLPELEPHHWRTIYANGVELETVSDAAMYQPMRDGDAEHTRALLLAAIDAAIDRVEAAVRRSVAAGTPGSVALWKRTGGGAMLDRRRRWWSEHRERMAAALH